MRRSRVSKGTASCESFWAGLPGALDPLLHPRITNPINATIRKGIGRTVPLMLCIHFPSRANTAHKERSDTVAVALAQLFHEVLLGFASSRNGRTAARK